MPFFTLGFSVGILATKLVRKLLKPYFEVRDTHVGGYNMRSRNIKKKATPGVLDVDEKIQSHIKEKQGSGDVDPTTDSCRFSDHFNGWMNKTLQAVLKLDILKQKLKQKPAFFSEALWEMPKLAKLFQTALQNPGKYFSSTEIVPALEELSVAIPSLRLCQERDIFDFLEPLLLILNKCGVETTLHVQKVFSCVKCQYNGNSTMPLANVFFLPSPGKYDTTSYLFGRVLNAVYGKEECNECNVSLVNEVSLRCPDVITLYLPLPATMSDFREGVPAADCLVFPAGNVLEKYRLSFIDLDKNGAIYMYEKYT